MTESELQRRIVKALNKLDDVYAVKIHGGPHQRQGLPDIIGCVQGQFFGYEVKLPGKENTLTRIQRLNLERIRTAGGIAHMVTSELQAIDNLLEEIGRNG